MNKKRLIVFGILLVVLLGIVAGICAFVVPKLIKKPAETVKNTLSDYDDYVCISVTYGEDPTTSVNITWQSFTSSSGCVMIEDTTTGETRLIRASSGLAEFKIPAYGESDFKNPTLEVQTGRIFRAYITGLTPGTTYKYRILPTDTDVGSSGYSFTTAKKDGDFSFLIVSDTQGSTSSDFQVWEKVATAAKTFDFDFIVHLGDNVEDGNNLKQWLEYWNAAGGLLESTPVINVLGNQDKKHTLNHYTYGGQDNRTALVSGYFSFEISNVHFSVLNTGDGDKDIPKAQLKWLKKDLEAAGEKQKIVLIHKAPYSNYNHCNDTEIVSIRAQLDPILAEYGVKIVLEGHDHVFYRSMPLSNGVPSENGTVFFMNSSAGYKQH